MTLNVVQTAMGGGWTGGSLPSPVTPGNILLAAIVNRDWDTTDTNIQMVFTPGALGGTNDSAWQKLAYTRSGGLPRPNSTFFYGKVATATTQSFRTTAFTNSKADKIVVYELENASLADFDTLIVPHDSTHLRSFDAGDFVAPDVGFVAFGAVMYDPDGGYPGFIGPVGWTEDYDYSIAGSTSRAGEPGPVGGPGGTNGWFGHIESDGSDIPTAFSIPSNGYNENSTHAVFLLMGEGAPPAEPLNCSFSGTPLIGRSPLAVQFTDLTTGEPTSWLWSFGDGETSTEQNPIHTYTAPGVYDVSLSVSVTAGAITDLALGATATTDWNHSPNGNGFVNPTRANDGSDSTGAQAGTGVSTSSTPPKRWIDIDLGADNDVSSIQLRLGGTNFDPYGSLTTAVGGLDPASMWARVQYSTDGSTYSDLTGTLSHSNTNPDLVTLNLASPVTARYFRYYQQGHYSNRYFGGVNVYRFSIYGAASLTEGDCSLTEPGYVTVTSTPVLPSQRDRIVLSIRGSFNDEDLYNHALVTGTGNKANIVYGEASDTDPDSPTRIDAIGDRVITLESDQITTQKTANKAALKLFLENCLISEDIDMEAICNPALEGNDVIGIEELTFSQLQRNFRIQSFTVPLSSSRQNLKLARVINLQTQTVSVNDDIVLVGYEQTIKTTASTSAIVPVPAGIANGDLMLMWVALDTSGDTINPTSSGFTSVTGSNKWKKKIASGSEGTSKTVSWSGARRAIVTLMVYRNVDQTDPIGALASAFDSDKSILVPALTLASGEWHLVSAVVGNGVTSYTWPTNWTEIVQSDTGGTGTTHLSASIADRPKVGSNPGSFNIVGAEAISNHTFQIALRKDIS